MADLPGLIEGSHRNLGMGHRFLKHVERTKLLLFIIDVNGFQLGPGLPHRSAFENLVLLNKEIELYNPDLLKKPCFLAVNKMDTPESQDKLQEFEDFLYANYDKGVENLHENCLPKRRLDFSEIHTMSAQNDEKSVLKLKQKLRQILDDNCDEESPQLVQKLREEINAIIHTDNKVLL